MPIERPEVLALIGHFPVQHGVTTAIENLMAAKSTLPFTGDGDNTMQGLFSQVIGGNLGSIFKNPMSVVAGSLTGALSSLRSLIPATIAGALVTLPNNQGTYTPQIPNPVATAITGAISSVSSLTDTANNLSGVTVPEDGQYGFMDVVGHSSLSNILGADSAYGISTVLGPVNSSGTLEAFLEQVTAMLPHATSNQAAITPLMASISSQTSGLVFASSNAIDTVRQYAPALAQIGAMAGALQSADLDTKAFIANVLQADIFTLLSQKLGPQSYDAGFYDAI